MDLHLEEVMGRLSDFLTHEARTETVIGEAFQLGEFHCIPVVRVGMGFGSGGGGGDAPKQVHGEGLGAGAGLGIEPIGFLVARGKEIEFVSTKTNKGLAAAFEKVPDLLNKYLEMRKKEMDAVPA